MIVSIRSQRYGMQKHLLKRSGYSRVMYLIEGDIDAHNNAQYARNACVHLQLNDGFTLLRTAGINDTLRTYKNLSKYVEELYSQFVGPAPPGSECVTMGALKSLLQSERTLTVQDMFKLQLQHIPGIGKQAAEAVVRNFPTPMRFWREAVLGPLGKRPETAETMHAAAKRLKTLPINQGLRTTVVGETKAKKILNCLLNVNFT
uniref:Crossover junction endonuclease MUS81 n=1 Tax=Chloropicon laureae TaxID=464258 RepID=A0A7S3E503_9CHLO